MDVDSGICHPHEKFLLYAETAYMVINNPYLHTVTAAVNENVAYLGAEFVVVENVELHVDGTLRSHQIALERLKQFGAADKAFHIVVRKINRTRQLMPQADLLTTFRREWQFAYIGLLDGTGMGETLFQAFGYQRFIFYATPKNRYSTKPATGKKNSTVIHASERTGLRFSFSIM